VDSYRTSEGGLIQQDGHGVFVCPIEYRIGNYEILSSGSFGDLQTQRLKQGDHY
jgi:hypothetical protein